MNRSFHEAEPWHVCVFCGKSFSSKGNLKVHSKLHAGKRDYNCDVCGLSFARSWSLKCHKLSHDSTKTLKCPESGCYQSFKHHGDLLRHKKKHSEERVRYSCPFEKCDKLWDEKWDLKRHIETKHLGKKDHVCVTCNKAFATKFNLTEHSRIHTGEKPCVCDICDKAFANHSTLRRHKSRHSPSSRHICSYCHKSFTRLLYLKSHLKVKHLQSDDRVENILSASNNNESSTSVCGLDPSMDDEHTNSSCELEIDMKSAVSSGLSTTKSIMTCDLSSSSRKDLLTVLGGPWNTRTSVAFPVPFASTSHQDLNISTTSSSSASSLLNIDYSVGSEYLSLLPPSINLEEEAANASTCLLTSHLDHPSTSDQLNISRNFMEHDQLNDDDEDIIPITVVSTSSIIIGRQTDDILG